MFVGRSISGDDLRSLLLLLAAAGRLARLLGGGRSIAGLTLGGIAMQLLQLAASGVVDRTSRPDGIARFGGKLLVVDLYCVISASKILVCDRDRTSCWASSACLPCPRLNERCQAARREPRRR